MVKGSFHRRYYPHNQSTQMEPSTGMLCCHLSKDLREICKCQSHHCPGVGSKNIILPQQKTLLLALLLAHICQPCCATRAHAHLGAFARAAHLPLYEMLLIKEVCYAWGQKLPGASALMSLAVWLVAEGWCGMRRQFLSKEGLCFFRLQTRVAT